MTFNLEVWHILTLGLTLVTMGSGMVKLIFNQVENRFDQRFDGLEKNAEQWRSLERDVLKLRAELPEKYLRREDYVRGQTVIEAKLDAIAVDLKSVQIKQGVE